MIYCMGRALKVEKQADMFTVTEVWKGESPANFNTPVLKAGFLYGLTARRNFFCVDAKTGEAVWTDATMRGECGEILDTGTVLIALTSDMELVVLKPGKEYAEVTKYKVAETPTWAYPIVDRKRIFIKDADSVTLWTLP
jgi:outer membrane protein assembly factor BamB